MPRGRVERESDKAAVHSTHVEPDYDVTADENTEAEAPKSADQKAAAKRAEEADDDEPRHRRSHAEVEHDRRNEQLAAAGLPVDPFVPDMPGYDEPEPPAEPDLSEPGQDVDNLTRDGMQVPVNADE